MKRYTREDMSDEAKLEILSEIGEVFEIVGNTARVQVNDIHGDGYKVLEISTVAWFELKQSNEGLVSEIHIGRSE